MGGAVDIIGKLVLSGVGFFTGLGLPQAFAIALVEGAFIFGGLQVLSKISQALTPSVDDLTTAQSGHQFTVRSTVEFRRIVYGKALVSGPIVYQNTAGTNNQRLFTLVAVAGHEIEDITDVWLDETEISDSDIDWAGDGSVDAGVFRGDTGEDPVVYLEKGLGTSTQTSSSFLDTNFTEWTSNHRGRGVAYLCARLDYIKNQEAVFERGPPQNFKALVSGKKVYDPRLDSTQPGGSGAHRVDDQTTWAWSENPALCLADYLRDTDIGFEESHTRIDWEMVQDAADVCDTLVSIPGATTQKRFTCNGVLSTGVAHADNIEALLSSMNGTLTFSGGNWRIRAWQYETPTFGIDEDDLRGDVKLLTNTEWEKRYNTVRAIYIDPDRQYQPSEMIEVGSASFETRDGAKLYRDIQLNMTNDEYTAQRLAMGIRDQSDQQMVLHWPGKWTCLRVNIGETVQVSLDCFSFTNKVFKCVGWKINTDGVDLLLREDDSSTYSDPASGDYATRTAAGAITFPSEVVPMPTDFVVRNDLKGPYCTWTPPANKAYDVTEIWRADVASWDEAAIIGESRTDYYQDNPIDPGLYHYFIRSRNYAGAVSTRVPLNGEEGLFLPDDFLQYDPTFDLTIVGTDDTRFWSPIGSIGGGGAFEGSAFVNSGGGGTGNSNKLTWDFTVNDSRFFFNATTNAKRIAIARNLDLSLWLRYRVNKFTNIRSAEIRARVYGIQNLRTNVSTLMSDLTVKADIVNSVGWSVYSYAIPVESLSNVSSHSYLVLSLYGLAYASTTNTGEIGIEFDEYLGQYN